MVATTMDTPTGIRPPSTDLRLALETAFAFLLRDAEGGTRVVHEIHVTGLFPRDPWLRLLADVGFEPEAIIEETTEDRVPRELFLARRGGLNNEERAR